jgi:putative two-component system response regulator
MTGSEPQPMPRVLIVDDDPGILMALKQLLTSDEGRYELLIASSPIEAISIFRKGPLAVIICDQAMPDMSGVELLTLVRQQSPTTVCIMITGMTDMKLAEEVVNQHLVHYFVTKPWDSGKMQQLLDQAIETHERRDPGEAYGEAAQLKAFEHASRAAFSLARAVDARDRYTHSHSSLVSAWSQVMGKTLGLTSDLLEEIRIGGLLHDLGKIGIPDEVLLKTGKLNDKEFHYIKMHPIIGVTITEPIDFPWTITAIVRQHHENHDGSGYPTGISGDEICLPARITHIVDAYEAMSANRVYRNSLPMEKIESEFERCSGSQFDPDLTKVFLNLLHENAFSRDTDPLS